MSKADVWMPLYIGDYLADTRRLTTEQHGAYLLLLMDYWRNGPPPDDAQTLAQITMLSPDAWSFAQAKLRHFFSIEDGAWRHKRVDEELAAAQTNHSKARAKAKAAAAARWGKNKKDAPSNAKGNAPSIPQAMLKECPSPSPSPLPVNQDDDDSTVGGRASSVPAEFTDGGFAAPKEAPLPMREVPPLSEDPAVQISVALRRQGVNANSVHPAVLDWAAKGVTIKLLTEAIAIARETKGSAPLPPNYLVPIVNDLLNPPVGRTPAPPRASPVNEKFNFNHLDRSGDRRAMDEGMKRLGITVPDSDEEIEI